MTDAVTEYVSFLTDSLDTPRPDIDPNTGPWTLFWDMHSGGGTKLEWDKIYLQLPEDEAIQAFTDIWRDPHNVTCDCCGPDYNVIESNTLEEATHYHRKKPSYYKANERIRGARGYRYNLTEEEEGELEKHYEPVSEYIARKNVLVMYRDQIEAER